MIVAPHYNDYNKTDPFHFYFLFSILFSYQTKFAQNVSSCFQVNVMECGCCCLLQQVEQYSPLLFVFHILYSHMIHYAQKVSACLE